jgi:hypothetical protein
VRRCPRQTPGVLVGLEQFRRAEWLSYEQAWRTGGSFHSGVWQWALTIHSSRSRFAARLNSGVRPRMKIFTSLLIFLTLSGCATSANVGYLSLCGAGDSRQWKPVDAPPDAAALRILADTSPNAPAVS